MRYLRLLLLVLALLMWASPARAQFVFGQQGVLPGGAVLLSASSCTATSPFAAPVAWVSRCFNTTNGVTYIWDSVGWQSDAALATKVVNVMDSRFGAKCDESTDDTTPIRNAIAALPTNGGMVLFPANAKLCKTTSQITIQKFNVRLVGAGSSNNLVNYASGILYVPTVGNTAAVDFDGANGGQRGGVAHLTIKQGNTQTNTNCLQISGQQKTVEDVSCLSFTGSSFALWADPAGSGDAIWNRFWSIYAQPAAPGGGGSVGIDLKGVAAGNRVVNSNSFVGCVVSMPSVANGGVAGQNNLQIRGPASDNTFDTCDLSPQDTGTGIVVGDAVSTARGNHFVNNTVEGLAGSTNMLVSTTAIGTWFSGFLTSAPTLTLNGQGWIFDTRLQKFYEFNSGAVFTLSVGTITTGTWNAGQVTSSLDMRLGTNSGAFRQLNNAGLSYLNLLSLDGTAADNLLLGNGLPAGAVTTINQGALAVKVGNGVIIGSPTGTYEGAGTINIATADGYFVNGTALKNITETLSNKTVAAPVFSGTATGTYTLGGTPTIGSGVLLGTSVALGGGVAPTLGTIGGSGPATAGQNSWMQVKDSAGATVWIPVWK